MVLKLWHKLVLAIVVITGIVLILAIILSRQSVKSGFLDYLNGIEARRFDSISVRLINAYESQGDWEFIRGNLRRWHHYTRPRPPQGSNQGRPPARLHELGERPGGFRLRPPSRPPSMRRPERPPESFGQGDRLQPFGGMPPPNMRRPPPPRGERHPPPQKMLALLDENKQLIVGDPQRTAQAIFKPIIVNDVTIAYIRFEPFNKITDELDQQFIAHQTRAFIKIALFALLIVLLGAWFISYYLRRRLNRIGDQATQLISGNFTLHDSDKSADELGQLSKQLKHLGETLENNRLSRQRWISDISHELRTPVAVLQGEIEAIQDGVRELSQTSIESLHQEILRMNRLVNDLHELSLSDMGALSYHREKLDIIELIEDVISQHQHQFDGKKLSLKIKSNRDKIYVHGDGQRLEQLFSNLANNSQHYTQESGQLVITIKQKGDKVVVDWSDSAPGVTNKELSLLFERLYRVESSRNRNAGGSGLGLSICQNIVEAHEGSIEARHATLGGISFVMKFPIHQ